MLPSAVKIDGRVYYLDAATAAWVKALFAQASGGSLVPDGGRVSTTLYMMDELKMKTIMIDGAEISVSDDAAWAIEAMQGRLAVLEAAAGGRLAVSDAAGAASEAMRQDGLRRRDLATPYGAHVARLGDAWKTAGNV